MAGFPIGHGDMDRNPNLVTCSFYHPGPLQKILSQFQPFE